ncbi:MULTISPECIES: bifunctional 3,4-dihydroxy-2-butanone-4-phosphate synthase/GTP cyclohydrolase II [Cetobacterium]|jgi:3,4-dihydroxy 2-butanone 4-phosphate synthase/GTP cyclohydrolase II|uniref:Riboflavin biosynthesis protein RibBA n=1 Tax=Candidatus Cetobacterium colombiensis TaxID=3073100 RepID=A0ABU4W776_9FUSO|nr:bifunctional 3,4-dihydroxy-2-butanone-4-phosphate synthase/GTP cyclohydrolase II [Candidatus Cetobacterium colombiensis]MDX8335396.1 bifunctional 3,4-dihydroxy-2-butanone-4-phosphate synthase/GTP cyclohydrolase II [Candidatus Cetobacterium colombiensis]
MFNKIEDAINDLKNGKLVVVVDNENRENEGDLIGIGEIISKESINFMIQYGRGLVCVPIEETRANELNLNPMVYNNSDSHQTAFTVSVDSVIGTTTGISVEDRYNTIKDLAFNAKSSKEFKKPGHIFPLIAKKGGVIERPGHTEAAVDLAKLAGFNGCGVICEIIKDNGEMARVPDLIEFCKVHNLKLITIEDLIEYRKRTELQTELVCEAPLPTKYGTFKLVGFSNTIDHKEHVALVFGDIKNKENVLLRVHSECLTGDAFGSLKCDCGSQLGESLKKIANNGSGVLLYMRQEGRGIGLLNKIKAYNLQAQGKDTVEANLLLGFDPDLRDFSVAAQMIKLLEIKSINLMTNNPKKIDDLTKYGIQINDRTQIEFPSNTCNSEYLKTKKEKMNHLFKIN